MNRWSRNTSGDCTRCSHHVRTRRRGIVIDISSRSALFSTFPMCCRRAVASLFGLEAIIRWRSTRATLGGDDRLETFEAALDEVEASTRPVEITGPTGTLVLWHQRLVHTAGRNTQRTVRHATLCDFKTQAFLAAADCKADDLWQTWSSRTKQVAALLKRRRSSPCLCGTPERLPASKKNWLPAIAQRFSAGKTTAYTPRVP